MPLGMLPDSMMPGMAGGMMPQSLMRNRVANVLNTAGQAGIGGGVHSMAQGPLMSGAQNRRPGLFGGLANLAKRGLGNFMAIDPQTRMMMGAGMMEGGLPGLARGYMSGQEAMQGREDRAFELAERERQAAERAQQQQALEAFIASRPEAEQNAARLNPTVAAEAALRRPEPVALPEGFMTDAQGRIVEVPGYFERQRELYNIRFGGRGGGGGGRVGGGPAVVDMGDAY